MCPETTPAYTGVPISSPDHCSRCTQQGTRALGYHHFWHGFEIPPCSSFDSGLCAHSRPCHPCQPRYTHPFCSASGTAGGLCNARLDGVSVTERRGRLHPDALVQRHRPPIPSHVVVRAAVFFPLLACPPTALPSVSLSTRLCPRARAHPDLAPTESPGVLRALCPSHAPSRGRLTPHAFVEKVRP